MDETSDEARQGGARLAKWRPKLMERTQKPAKERKGLEKRKANRRLRSWWDASEGKTRKM
jgi:hypothetical protein